MDNHRNKDGTFATGHTYWQARTVHGQGKKFKTPEDLQKAVDAYFVRCDSGLTETIYNKRNGKEVTINTPIPYTIEGLVNMLSISRNCLKDYKWGKGYEAYHHIIRNARNKIQ
ncbi:unnamed protein product, partial [marine sediment metagenome]